jgi:hypothetical protein
MDEHSEEAATFAAGRADKLLEDGDIHGALVWRRILAAMEELQRGQLALTLRLRGRCRAISRASARDGARGGSENRRDCALTCRSRTPIKDRLIPAPLRRGFSFVMDSQRPEYGVLSTEGADPTHCAGAVSLAQ